MIRASSVIGFGKLCLRHACTLPLFVRAPPHLRFSTSSTFASSPSPPVQFKKMQDYSKLPSITIEPLFIVPSHDSEYLPVLARSLKVPVVMLKLFPQNDTAIFKRKGISRSQVPVHVETPIKRCQIRTSSLVLQVFSVIINTNVGDEKPCLVYGSISATDSRGTIFNLYNRCSADCENFGRLGNLSLVDPDVGGMPLSLGTGATMNIDLKDKTRETEIINAKFDLVSNTKDLEGSCDVLVDAVVEGVHGSASVYYTIFRSAVFASVKVMFFSGHREDFEIFGRIVAKYGNSNSKECCFSGEDMKRMETVLFDHSPDQTVDTVIYTPIQLSRHVVAVPAFSSLIIEAELSDDIGKITDGFAEFPAQESGQFSKLIGRHALLLVDVTWNSVNPSR